jgi:L-arabinose transport system permease protein
MTLPELDRTLDYASPDTLSQRLYRVWDSAGMLLIFVALVAIVSLTVPNFLSWVNLKGLLLSVATVGLIACTMLFCLAAGDFDLSVGRVVALSGVLAAVVSNLPAIQLGAVTIPIPSGLRIPLGFLVGILAGGVVGLVNGFVIARLGINALITTLATMQIVRGLTFIASNGKAVGVYQAGFDALGNSSLRDVAALAWLARVPGGWWLLDIPTPLWLMAACFVLFGLLLTRTVFGRNVLAIGGNREAARLAGIAVTRTKLLIFTLQGLVSGLAGITLASRLSSGQPGAAEGLELQVISACVLGGVSLTGGVGTMLGTIVGVLIMGTVQNAMSLKGVPTFYQYVISGLILLAAVLIDRLKQRRGT